MTHNKITVKEEKTRVKEAKVYCTTGKKYGPVCSSLVGQDCHQMIPKIATNFKFRYHF